MIPENIQFALAGSIAGTVLYILRRFVLYMGQGRAQDQRTISRLIDVNVEQTKQIGAIRLDVAAVLAELKRRKR